MPLHGLIKGETAKADTPMLDDVTASITGTGAVTIKGKRTVSGAQATVQNSPTALPTDSCSVTSISGTSVNVVVTEHAAAANAVEGSALNVSIMVKESA